MRTEVSLSIVLSNKKVAGIIFKKIKSLSPDQLIHILETLNRKQVDPNFFLLKGIKSIIINKMRSNVTYKKPVPTYPCYDYDVRMKTKREY